MPKITKICIEKIIAANTIIPVVDAYQETTDPETGKDFKTKSHPKLILNTNKPTALAYTDGNKGYNSVSYLMEFHGKTYPEALKEIAEIANITLEYDTETTPEPQKKPTKGKPVANPGNYRDQTLKASGIKEITQKTKVLRIENGQEKAVETDVYTSGTIDGWDFSTIKPGNDLIIKYIGLDNKEVMTTARTRTGTPKGKPFPFVRIRFQTPREIKKGRTVKYLQGPRTGIHIYYPVKVREAFGTGRKIKTLLIQEGEKKADKTCQEGHFSIAVPGINSIAQDKRLPPEVGQLIAKCNIENVVFIVDGDYLDLGHSKKEAVNFRPNNFFVAVRNFQQYFKSFINQEIFLNLYFGYIKGSAKGIDDLYVAHPGKEDEITKDITATLNIKNGKGQYLDIHNITSAHEYNLKEYFKLHNRDVFFKHHFNELKARQYFKFNREKFRYNSEINDFELDQPMTANEMFYKEQVKEDKNGNEVKTYKLDPERMTIFLQNRGFHRYSESIKAPTYFVEKNSDSGIIREVEPAQIKDYIFDFTRENVRIHDVINLLHNSPKGHLNETGIFSTLSYVQPDFHQSTLQTQYYYFRENFVKITPEKIEVNHYKQLTGYVWRESISERDFNLLETPFEAKIVEKTEDEPIMTLPKFDFIVNEAAFECEFFDFLYKTSNFYHRKAADTQTEDEQQETLDHLLNKLTAFGYLLVRRFNPAVAKIVIAVDGKESEIGDNNGRTGKSVFAKLLAAIVSTENMDGKRYEKENYPWENVSSRTALINLDDPRPSFDLESLFSMVTGNFIVEGKGSKKFTIPEENTPKVYVATNHGISANGSSERDRTFFMAFSDYFSDTRKPSDPEEYGHLFLNDWTDTQYNAFLNTAFYAVQLYLKVGLVPAPQTDIKTRALRANMTDKFLYWADRYFHEKVSAGTETYTRLEREISRIEMFEDYKKEVGQAYAGKATTFKKRLIAYCEYSGYILNPGVVKKDPKTGVNVADHGGYIKKSGVEYFLISKPIEVTE